MRRLRTTALLALLLFSTLAARADEISILDTLSLRFNLYSTLCSPEKVYLHFDRTCYTAGESIWFKGWVQDASRNSCLPPSNFLYAEVLNDSGEAVVRVKIKRSGDGFPGCIELPDNLKTGDYTIRAYTLWLLNYDNEYLFNDRIRIIGDTRQTKETSNPSQDRIEISFWPEGGRYFSGYKSAIGFKAVDGAGRSMDFSGYLVSDSDAVRIPVSTVHDGMGTFTFLPRRGRNYGILDANGKIHPLPAPSSEGATLRLQVRDSIYCINAVGFGGGIASLLIRDSDELRPLGEIDLNGKPGILMMEKSFFRPGINHFLLVNSHGQIMAERLFFIRDDNAPICEVDMESFPPAPRAPVRGDVYLTDPDGSPLDGSCSMSVVRGALRDWQQNDGIISYMGLSSELKGRINKPFYYFDPRIPEQERDFALDILMMIQGWRYYDLEKINEENGARFRFNYKRELVQEIRGRVSRMLSSKMPKKFTFNFTIPKMNVFHSVDVDKGNSFIIDSLDFQENTEMLISIGTSRLGASYLPRWNGDPAAEPYLYKPAPGFATDAVMNAPVLDETSPGDTLSAAVVTASYDDEVLSFGRSYRRDLEIYKDLTLVEYLSTRNAMFEYDGENMYNRNRRWKRYGPAMSDSMGEMSDSFGAGGMDDETGLVKLIADDSEAAWWAYDMLRLEDLRSLIVSTQPDPIYGGEGGVVHISIKPGAMRTGTFRDPSLLYFVPLGYQVPRYFESPRYDLGEERPYDGRNTIWWSPEVKLEGGAGTFEFCNNDLNDYPYIIRIEGRSSDGRPFSLHCIVAPDSQ
ncbi:MAG: hypothetical protein J5737_05515 [Bacteroidales bacterium]|nr:hypothetical protein [Bacteroidales bacterium]